MTKFLRHPAYLLFMAALASFGCWQKAQEHSVGAFVLAVAAAFWLILAFFEIARRKAVK